MFNLEEQESVEALKAWWKRHGNAVVLALTVLVAAVAGIQGWRYYQQSQARQAAALYNALQGTLATGSAERVREVAGQIIQKYPRTGYAPRAALISAKANYQAGDAKSAKAQLQWAAEHAAEAPLRDVARLQLASILLDQKDFQGALKWLEAKHGAAFNALYDDLKGDVLVAQGKPEQARAAYRTALQGTAEDSPYRKLIQVKLDALGEGK